MVVYPIGSTKACQICAGLLRSGTAVLTDHPTPDVTHLLLDVPSFSIDGSLRAGGRIEDVLPMLPETITVIGGNLAHPALRGYPCMDLLKEEAYLARNAAITADCTIKVMSANMAFVFEDCPVLILGWGRIGKCLSRLLRNLGCRVTVAARKESDRAILNALGYQAVDYSQAAQMLHRFRILCNTVPEVILPFSLPDRCLGIELASKDGIQGGNIIPARGLPGTLAPESTGKLMADTILTLCQEVQL